MDHTDEAASVGGLFHFIYRAFKSAIAWFRLAAWRNLKIKIQNAAIAIPVTAEQINIVSGQSAFPCSSKIVYAFDGSRLVGLERLHGPAAFGRFFGGGVTSS